MENTQSSTKGLPGIGVTHVWQTYKKVKSGKKIEKEEKVKKVIDKNRRVCYYIKVVARTCDAHAEVSELADEQD